MIKKEDFRNGLIDGLPICFGYFSVAFAFGIFCVNSGLSAFQALAISLTNVTSAGQLAGIPIIINHGTLIEMAATEFIINLRYALMSISLSQKLDRNVTMLDRLWIAFVNTDEVFAVSSSKSHDVSKQYMAGLILSPYFGWAAGTIVGGILGDILPSILTVSLGIAIYGMFIAIVTPVAKIEHATLCCVCVSIVLSCILYYFTDVPNGFSIIICALVSSALMSVLYPVKQEEV